MELMKYVPYIISRAAGELGALKAKVLEEFKLNLREWRVLVALGQENGQRVTDLSELALTEISTLSRVLDSMEQRKLVRRKRARPNARAVTVHLTATGRRLMTETLRDAARYEDALLEGVDKKDLAVTMRVLKQIHDNARLHKWQSSARKETVLS